MDGRYQGINGKVFVILAICLLLAFSAACAPDDPDPDPVDNDDPPDDEPYGGEMRLANIAEIGNTDRIFAPTGIAVGVVQRIIHDSLMKLDINTGEYVPRLAEEWEILDDGTRWRFHLREGATFHNGEEVTAHDVERTFEVGRNPDYESPFVGRFDSVDNVEVIDDYTVDIHLKSVVAPAAEEDLVEHFIYPRSVYETREDIEAFGYDPVGAGPFQVAEWEEGSHMVLEAHEGYYFGRPYLDTVYMQIIPDGASRIMALEADETDVLFDVEFEDLPRLQERDDLYLFSTQPRNMTYLGLHMENWPLSTDKRVRQAVAYAVNQDSVVQLYTVAEGERTLNALPPESWAYNPNVSAYDYDPERALELLEEAGWVQDDDGVLRDQDGEPFRIDRFITTPDRLGLVDQAAIVEENLGDIGIDVDIRSYEFTTFFQYVREGEHEMFTLRWTNISEPDFLRNIFHSAEVGAGNRTWFANPTVDGLLEEARVTVDVDDRKDLYWEVQEIMAEEVTYIPLAVTPYWLAAQEEFAGFVENPPTANDIWDGIHEVYMRK